MNYYNMDLDEAIKVLNTSKKGLTINEVNNRLEIYGKNILLEKKKKNNIIKFIDQFNDLMIIILIIAAVVSFFLSLVNNESFIDSIIIILIVIINAILGFIQESKADKSLESLIKMQVPNITVRRENKICIVNSEDIVPGDIVILQTGDIVPADCRIIYEASLKVDESSLTGESLTVSKDAKRLFGDIPLSERKNMIYLGTSIVYGKCEAVVCETAMNTEFGLIADSLNKEEKKVTPLETKINSISKFLSIIIAIIIVIIFIIGIIKDMNIKEILMLCISLAVAAIPEGLMAIITVILSLGISDMAKKNAIVRKMSSVETLGCTQIICSDKTGTITQNKMEVRKVFYDNKLLNLDNINKDNILFNIMILNNDSIKNNGEYIGDPTEVALYKFCENYLNVDEVRKTNKRISELPFDSDRKMMSTLNKNSNSITIYTKGSFDSIINRCSYVYENNNIVKLTDKKKSELKQVEINQSNKSYRVLAFAFKDVDIDTIDETMENNLIFVGMTCMIDPPRIGVKESIELCKNANIKPIMITGDSLSTAVSIAKEIGILENSNEAITGSEIDKMSYEQLKKAVNKYSVYARVSPMNKLSIVNALRDNKKVVAMTGDGANDAPALKNADIAVGMGITGTQVSKEVSDIILSDDSFSTIVFAVKEGRRIFDNIRNILVYLLTGNIAEVLVVFIGMIFGLEIFLPIQLLYINLITDSIPAITLAFEKEEKNIMYRKVRKKEKSFFTPFIISKISLSAILKTFAILLVYVTNLKLYDTVVATSMAFLTLVLLEMIFTYSCKNLKSNVINRDIFSNKYINNGLLILLIIQIILFTTPIKSIFGICSLNFVQITYCVLVVIIIFVIDELSKNIIKKLFKD